MKKIKKRKKCNHEPLLVTRDGRCGYCGKQLNIKAVPEGKAYIPKEVIK